MNAGSRQNGADIYMAALLLSPLHVVGGNNYDTIIDP